MPNSVVTRRPFRKRGQAQGLFFLSVPPPPMELSLTYLNDFGRIQIELINILGNVSYVTVERSTDGITWETVRGGSSVSPDTGTATHYDYEFPSGVEITYRVKTFSGTDVELDTLSDVITVNLESVWLKSVEFPFLNRPVVVIDWSPVQRQFRGGVFPVIGRSLPVAVTDLRGSRKYTLETVVQTPDAARDIDYLLASGGSVFVHVPGHCDVPQMYAIVEGASSESRAALRSQRRIITLPLMEIAKPKLSIVGAMSEWQTLLATFGTWEAIISAYPVWDELLDALNGS